MKLSLACLTLFGLTSLAAASRTPARLAPDGLHLPRARRMTQEALQEADGPDAGRQIYQAAHRLKDRRMLKRAGQATRLVSHSVEVDARSVPLFRDSEHGMCLHGVRCATPYGFN